MQMCIMLAINPPHSRNIMEGIKRVEWRKRPLWVGRRTFIYETKNGGGCGMVIGEVVLAAARSHRIFTEISDLLDVDIDLGCVPKDELKQYAGKEPILWAHDIFSTVEYPKPISISEFGLKRPPLSWCYCAAGFESPDLPDWDILFNRG